MMPVAKQFYRNRKKTKERLWRRFSFTPQLLSQEFNTAANPVGRRGGDLHLVPPLKPVGSLGLAN